MVDGGSALFTTSRRRSTRVRLAVPLLVTRFSSADGFTQMCETLSVSNHGCNFLINQKLLFGETLRLDIPHSERRINARVVRSQNESAGKPASGSGVSDSGWMVGVELERAENFWGIHSPPPDWVSPDNKASDRKTLDRKTEAWKSPEQTSPSVAPPEIPRRKGGNSAAASPAESIAKPAGGPEGPERVRLPRPSGIAPEGLVRELQEQVLDGVGRELFEAMDRRHQEIVETLQGFRGEMIRLRESGTSREAPQRAPGVKEEEPGAGSSAGGAAPEGAGALEELQEELQAVLAPGERILSEMKQQVEEWSGKLPQREAQLLERVEEATMRAEEAARGLERNLQYSEETIRKKLDDATQRIQLLDERSRNTMEGMEQGIRNLTRPAQEEMRGLADRIMSVFRHELSAELEAHKERLRAASEAQGAAVEEKIGKHLEALSRERGSELRRKLEDQINEISLGIIRRAESALEQSASAAVIPAEQLAADMRRQVEDWEAKLPRQEQQLDETLRKVQLMADGLSLGLEKRVQDFETAIHDRLVETTGEIKGKMEWAVQGAQLRLEEQSRALRAEMESVTAGGQREAVEESLAEIRRSLQAKVTEAETALRRSRQEIVAEALAALEKRHQEMVQQYSQRLEKKLGEALETIS
ncbi:MAG: PilZ domain-containing protein, partial [Acidobacteria bacterium]|nr:PilZ domain-containing protein [Acidobacteriota bacterium]